MPSIGDQVVSGLNRMASLSTFGSKGLVEGMKIPLKQIIMRTPCPNFVVEYVLSIYQVSSVC